jgi:hypothetical protein
MATTVDQKLLKSTKFPPEFNQKVDMQKVNLEVMKRFAAFPLRSLTRLTLACIQVDCRQDLQYTRR